MRKTHFWRSDGLITLIATLLGVFLALYLNEWNSSRKLKKEKEIATENILQEITSNKEKLTETVKKHTEAFEILSFIKDNIDDEKNITTSTEEMTQFRTNHPNIIAIKDSIKLDNGNYKYLNGEINFNFSLPQLELRTIAWETLKNSNILSTYDFDYLMNLEFIYKATNDISQKNQELFDIYIGLLDDFDANIEKLVNRLKIILDFEKSLIDAYNESPEKLKNCG